MRVRVSPPRYQTCLIMVAKVSSFPHETVAFIANDLVSEQRNSKACGRIKACPLTNPSGSPTDHYAWDAVPEQS